MIGRCGRDYCVGIKVNNIFLFCNVFEKNIKDIRSMIEKSSLQISVMAFDWSIDLERS
ncbi:MAG: hypothetical protein ABJA90_00690 [Ginsengibacter sp.]